MNHINTL